MGISYGLLRLYVCGCSSKVTPKRPRAHGQCYGNSSRDQNLSGSHSEVTGHPTRRTTQKIGRLRVEKIRLDPYPCGSGTCSRNREIRNELIHNNCGRVISLWMHSNILQGFSGIRVGAVANASDDVSPYPREYFWTGQVRMLAPKDGLAGPGQGRMPAELFKSTVWG